MIPVFALVGRPNVGKSTLFNRLTKTRDALVANLPGLTRDRQYGEVTFGSRHFIVIDTAGITGQEEGIDSAVAQQSQQAVLEADAIVFMTDAREGLNALDEQLAQKLRVQNKPIFFVANKIDGVNEEVALAELSRLGAAKLYPTTATHGRGIRPLIEDMLALFPVEETDAVPSDQLDPGVKIAIVGRPNVGKSTLVNRLLGEERVVVYDQPGTTRDSVYIRYQRNDEIFTLIDTAGIRRRKNVSETVEKFSIVKTLKAIDDANVVILVLDASEGIVDQDLHLLGHSIEAGRALVVAINKWDGLEDQHKQYVKNELERRLQFIDYAQIHFISALHGTGVGHLYESVRAAFKASTQKLQTHKLTQILERAIFDYAPPLVSGRRIKLRYAHAGGNNPPIIVIHGNQTEEVPRAYQKYLEKVFRRELEMVGTPVRIEFRTGENPFAGKRNKLNERLIAAKKRPVRPTKKSVQGTKSVKGGSENEKGIKTTRSPKVIKTAESAQGAKASARTQTASRSKPASPRAKVSPRAKAAKSPRK
ncbi:MAG: der [Verrucomicrobiaceae bacterium]|nr:der [Verrucomicrobiaceae bacterium]